MESGLCGPCDVSLTGIDTKAHAPYIYVLLRVAINGRTADPRGAP